MVKANVQGNTEIELIEHTIKFNDGVIIGTNHTGKLSKKTEFVEDIKKNWFKLILLYAGFMGTSVLTRLPNLDSMTIMHISVLCIVVTFALFYSRNIKIPKIQTSMIKQHMHLTAIHM